MKTFDEAEIVKLVKTQKMSIDEYRKTKDKEISIEEKFLEAEKRIAKTLEDIGKLAANNKDVGLILDGINVMLNELRKQSTAKPEKRLTKWAMTFDRNSDGFIDGNSVKFKAMEE